MDLNSERALRGLQLGVKDMRILMRKNCFLWAAAQLETGQGGGGWGGVEPAFLGENKSC